MAAMTLTDVLLAVPLGLLAGALAGLLGIGGGLIFAPLLLWMGLSPHQALATSTFAIVPTALGGSFIHLRSRSLQLKPALAIGLAACLTAWVFSQLGRLVSGWHLLTLQSLLYVVLTFTIRGDRSDSERPDDQPLPLAGLTAVGGVAGLAGGMLGLGGGLLMVPLMVSGLSVPIRQAIRLSTLAVACSATAASLQFLQEGRGQWMLGVLLGAVAAVAAQWTASRLDSVRAGTLAWLLRGLAALLAVDSGRRALELALQQA